MQDNRVLPSSLQIAKRRAISNSKTSHTVLVGVLLLLIMIAGGYFRFVGLNWDDFTHNHPDERFLTEVAFLIGGNLNLTENGDARVANMMTCLDRYPDTNGVGGYFDARCSNLNPHNVGKPMYVYGTLPLFMARGLAEVTVDLSQLWALYVDQNPNYNGNVWVSYSGVHLVWRGLSAAAEMGVILLTFLIGLKLHDKWIGITAAALYAFAVFSIQMAHFGTADATGNFFCALALYFAVLIQRKGGLFYYVLFGVAFGAALASRINLAPMAGVLIAVGVYRALPVLDRNIAWGERERLLIHTIGGYFLAGFFTILVFRIANPYAFNGPDFLGLSINPRFLKDLSDSRGLVSGALDFPPNYQWASRTPYLYPLKDMVLWGMGIAFGVVAWVSWVWSGWRIIKGRASALMNFLPMLWILGYFGYMGAQWVMVIRYYIPLYAALAVLASWGMLTLIRNADLRKRRVLGVLTRGLLFAVLGFTFLWALMFTNIYRNQLTRVQASHWIWENVSGDFSMRVEGAPQGTPLINIAIPQCSSSQNLIEKATCFTEFNRDSMHRFIAPADGIVTSIYAPHLGDPLDDPEPEVLRFTILSESDYRIVGTATLESDLPRTRHVLGDAYDIALDTPFEVVAGDSYIFQVEALSGLPIVSGGSVFTWEGAWDDPQPTKVCELPFGITTSDNPPPGLARDSTECNGLDPWWGLVNGHQLDIIYQDDEGKRQRLLMSLNESDYIAVNSNRFYDSILRNPQRWPLSMNYYEWLFDGSLGFELVAQFDETFELGPLRISDQVLPNYENASLLLNEIESDEAFSVYDHPAVFIFRKSDDYDPVAVSRLFYSVPLARTTDGRLLANCPDVNTFYCDPTLVNVNEISTSEVARAPTQLRFSPDLLEIQSSGGTWSQRFFPDSAVNTNMALSVIMWWAVIMVFGWAAFPLLAALMPSTADRGYAVSKFVGMFLVGWTLWFIASARIPVWWGGGVAVGLGGLFLLSIFTAWRTKFRFRDFIRARWKLLLIIDVLMLLAFLVFLGVRLSNPDLWHAVYGGEKPMDFAYFNGVLRSTVFPPVDPWNAGGFINYYYFGFVIVATPVLLLGMIPSIAYNLILPTLFAMTGIGAFSVAYNVVNAWRERQPAVGQPTVGQGASERQRKPRRLGNPLAAGLVAFMLAVVLGNLDTPRVFLTGVATMGGYQKPAGIQEFFVDEHIARTGEMPIGVQMDTLIDRAENANIIDSLRYEINNSVELVGSLGRGFTRLLNGDRLNVSADRWFWGPSRVLAETPGVGGNAITEMPAFTFIYGDMHAHMISMPMQLFILLFLLNEVLTAGDARRRMRFFAVALGAIMVGMVRATNTWDWITYFLFGMAGLAFSWWLRFRTLDWSILSRRSVMDFVVSVGGFVVIQFAAVIPYTTWFVSSYNSVKLWLDGKTPIWAYLDIHGLFVFLIITLLVWDTARWFRATKVSVLRGRYAFLLIVLLLSLTGLLGILLLTMVGYQVTLLVLPLIIWAVVLFFRSGQSRAMQFVLAMTALALSITLGVEYIVLTGDIDRQNTVFKFYLQAWLMFSVAGGVAFSVISRGMARWNDIMRSGWSIALVVLVGVAAMFPIMATLGKSVLRYDVNQPLTLDGMDYMLYATQHEGSGQVLDINPTAIPFQLEGDYHMIRWLQDNIQGSPTIIEGMSEGTEYKWNGRVSIYTGLPAVIGWRWHQNQQHTLNTMGRQVDMRVANVNAFYQTTELRTAWNILAFYDVQYIIVSDLERAYYMPQGLAKFDNMVTLGLLEVVYQEGNSTVYRVKTDADFDALTQFG